MPSKILTYETIIERDIDLLLIEELASDDEFCDWLNRELNLPTFIINPLELKESVICLL